MKTTMIHAAGRIDLRITTRTYEGKPSTQVDVWSRDRYTDAVVADIAAKLGGRPCGNSVMWGREVAAEEIERAATQA